MYLTIVAKWRIWLANLLGFLSSMKQCSYLCSYILQVLAQLISNRQLYSQLAVENVFVLATSKSKDRVTQKDKPVGVLPNTATKQKAQINYIAIAICINICSQYMKKHSYSIQHKLHKISYVLVQLGKNINCITAT